MAAENPPQEKKSNRRMLVIIMAIVIFEAALILGVIMIWTGPATVDASSMPNELDIAGGDRIVETLVLDARLPNNRTGVTFLYDTEIYVQTQERHVERVRRELDQFQNEIRADLSAIWRTSEPHHFQEPRLDTLTRKVTSLLNERFGVDEKSGEPIIEKCVVVMGTGFRVDS
ncbi:MAG: hypothetical protein EA377_08675 [Phycisphaerales bacterium]|nr:MAG: hypothetical protein EA377_08675 [Phycisphaerales bacterium]